MDRIYQFQLQHHIETHRQMVFLSGARQAGKTTLSRLLTQGRHTVYLSWDDTEHREQILAGTKHLSRLLKLDTLMDKPRALIFDEIHKYDDWKNLLKGYFDVLEGQCQILVTGSAKLDVYTKGGDSLMGRYFNYRIHPLSVAEIVNSQYRKQLISEPVAISEDAWRSLLDFGGFPEPYLKGEKQFYNQWVRLRQEQLFREDLRDMAKAYDLARVELLASLLRQQVGSQVIANQLATKVKATAPTVDSWLELLKRSYYCFSIQPWHNNVTRSLIKSPKYYLWDWSLVQNPGAKIENLVASHLLKAVHYWTDCGFGDFDLFYLRDKDKREVDFLVAKDNQPWFIVEVKKSSNAALSKNLLYFKQQLNVPQAFQAVYDMTYVDQDVFTLEKPMIIPLRTLLSQLI